MFLAVMLAVPLLMGAWYSAKLKRFGTVITDNLTVNTAATMTGTAAFNGNVTLGDGASSELYETEEAVAVTSATASISANNRYCIKVTSADGGTSITSITGGTTGQLLKVRAGATYAIEFIDSSTSLTVGTVGRLAGGENDCIILKCTNAEGDEWYREGGSNN